MLTPGTKLGPYEIVSRLGAGGMGEVYRAFDSQLKREVAIKILPGVDSRDPERLGRFQREAEATAALNHPNILSIHHIGQEHGIPHIVTELLHGETLRESMRNGPLPIRKAVEYAIEIVRGLAAAHEKGITHRDLKPENVFVTRNGHIKILDFGLAKLKGAERQLDETVPTVDVQTGSGVVLGTVGYMSPEQVRGQPADGRADIFAFGAILYEMLAGKRAFRGQTAADTQSAILREEPPDLMGLNPRIPPAIDRIVRRCLEKSANQRFQSAQDLGYALETISAIVESAGTGVAPSVKATRTNALAWVGVAGAAVAMLAAGLAWWFRPAAVPQVESIVQLTDDGERKEDLATLATDGSRVYFIEKYAGNWRLAQVSASGGQVAPVNTQIARPFRISMAPDFSGLLVSESVSGPHPLWFQPLPAGDPRRLGNLEGQDAVFSPDGKLIIYVNDSTLYAADRDGSNSRKLVDLPGYGLWLAFSPDGKQIRLSVAGDNSESIWEVSANGTGLHQSLNFSDQFWYTYYGRWTANGKYFLFQGIVEGHGDIWAISEGHEFLRRTRAPIQVTSGPLSCGMPTPSPSGKQVFIRCAKLRGELVRYDRKSQQFVPFLGGISATDVMYSLDGKWVIYLSYPERLLWRMRADGTDRLQLTFPPFMAWTPRISPDGTKVVFATNTQTSKRGLYIVSMAGGAAQKVVGDVDDAISPYWSPLGNSFVFQVRRPGMSYDEQNAYEIHLIDLRSGKISLLPGSEGKGVPVWASGATLVAGDTNGNKLFRYNFETQKWSDLADLAAKPLSDWVSTDGKYVYCTTMEPAVPEALRIRVPDGKVERLADLTRLRRVVVFASKEVSLTPNGELLFTRDIGTQEIYALNVRWP